VQKIHAKFLYIIIQKQKISTYQKLTLLKISTLAENNRIPQTPSFGATLPGLY
jgi:hypothetical protein